jgi:ribosomal protein S18 acetylase RimI-like enzyme
MFEVHRLSPERREDFYSLLAQVEGCGWCSCVAWWTETWDGWGERTGEENRSLREALFARGECDGYLLYADGEPAGWCQAGPRDRLRKLRAIHRLEPDPSAWAISCLAIPSARRRQGMARHLLEGVLADLRARGVRRVEAFPRRGADLPDDEVWTGPESLFVGLGFGRVKDEGGRGVYALDLPGASDP